MKKLGLTFLIIQSRAIPGERGAGAAVADTTSPVSCGSAMDLLVPLDPAVNSKKLDRVVKTIVLEGFSMFAVLGPEVDVR